MDECDCFRHLFVQLFYLLVNHLTHHTSLYQHLSRSPDALTLGVPHARTNLGKQAGSGVARVQEYWDA